MSDDLISRQAVLKYLYEIKDDSCIPKNYGTILDIIRNVRNIPTAFDKEKVIEKIKDESRAERLEDVSISGNVYGYNIERVINEEDVIEIVEKGGIN